MKKISRILSLFLFVSLLTMSVFPIHAQQPRKDHSPSEQQGKAWAGNNEHMDAPESEDSVEQYRHSNVVRAVAHAMHLKVETTAQIFEDLNSAILIGAIAFFLLKMVPKMFRQRSERIQKGLSEARVATEDANRRLAAVEARLSRLDSEIDAVRQQVEHDAVEDEKRIHAMLDAERDRIVASAEQEIAAAQAAAQRELKKFAADLAIDHAMRKIQLTADTDRALIRDFARGLKNKNGGEA